MYKEICSASTRIGKEEITEFYEDQPVLYCTVLYSYVGS